MPSKIEWCDESINPVIGCSKKSEGCANCYAEKQAHRLATFPHTAERYAGLTKDGRWTGKTNLVRSELDKPLKWRKPRVIFVSSMGDLFHESVPDEWIFRVGAVMALAHWHTFAVLTKRVARMRELLTAGYAQNHDDGGPWEGDLPPNIWWGTTIENQARADERLPDLLAIPGRHWVSVEPMLDPIVLEADWLYPLCINCGCHAARGNDLECDQCGMAMPRRPGLIDWVVAGCESGPKRRETKIEWVRDLRDQCAAAGVPFFLKQLDVGGKVASMPELDGVVHDEVPW